MNAVRRGAKLLRLFRVGLIRSVQAALTYRINLLFDVLLALVRLGAGLAGIAVVYARTDSLAGWTEAEAYVLIGTFQLLSSLKSAFVDPNLSWFPEQGIRQGRLDLHLLQPASTLYLASLARSAPLALIEFVLGAGIVGLGLARYGRPPTATAVVAWVVALVVGLAVTWSIGVLLACLAFWAPRLQLDVFSSAAWELARYPVDIYRRPLRLLLTYVFPLALIATVPTTTLLDGPQPMIMAGSVAGGVVIVIVAVGCWRWGLRRYTGATS